MLHETCSGEEGEEARQQRAERKRNHPLSPLICTQNGSQPKLANQFKSK